ncbi:MAG: TIGR04282 family arsenosugar biosynthesis glycosyltransferase [Leptolyngbya sp. Prado105]|jgi:hypothetical protein|nr:TIGR04282 family arsenosugar biosynthesis glycosyltransferase [Leptolyngbya sp. Prado105]
MGKEQLIVFTRYPEAGKAKTRLIPALGATRAAELHRQMTEKTIAKSRTLNLPISIHFTGGTLAQMQHWLGSDLVYYPQRSGDLGDRLTDAFQIAFDQEAKSAIAIGTDCPELTPEILALAFSNLKTEDVTLGGATDGGYYLIGLNRFVPDVFQNIQWSTEIVFQQTVEIVKRLGLSIAELPTLHDIDRPEDLQYLT